MGGLRQSIAPVLEVVLSKCGDAGRRISERSVACVVELVVRGVVDFAFIFHLVLSSVHHTTMYQLDGLSTTNGKPVNTDAATGATWRWWLGRLTILDRLMSIYTDRFITEARAHLHHGSAGVPSGELAINPLELSRNWCQPALTHSHLKVKKAAGRLLRRVRQLEKVAQQLPTPDHAPPARQSVSCGGRGLSLGDLDGVSCGALLPPVAVQDADEEALEEATAMAQALSLAEAKAEAAGSCGSCAPWMPLGGEEGTKMPEQQLAATTNNCNDAAPPTSFHYYTPCCVSHKAPQQPTITSPSCCPCSRKGRACISPGDIQTSCLRHNPQQLSLQLAIGPEYREGTHWEKGALLGTGASASVYTARDVASQALVTVKQVSFFRNTHDGEQRVLRDVTREIDVMRRLEPHPHVVEYYGAVVDGHHCNVFMQHMSGGSVADSLAAHGPLAADRVACLTRQVLAGLQYLHCHGVLHRDLKGANALLDDSGAHLRLCDFGTAAMLGNLETQPGEFKSTHGTAAFMAPEVIRG